MSKGLKSFFSSLSSKKVASPKHVVGIDFGSSSIKIVELLQKENVLTLKTYGELQLGPYANQELGTATRLPVPQRIEALVDVIRESKSTASSGVMTLPLASSFVTVFSLNATEGEDIAPRVRVEARKYIPVPMTEVALDWSELPPLGDTPDTVREVLVAAVQNEANKETHELLHAIKMDSQPTEVELFSVLRAVSKAQDESIAIIDLGAQTSKLYVAHQGVVRKIHRVFAGGQQASEKIAKALACSFEEAENYKRNYTADQEHATDIKKSMTATFERPLQEFKRVLSQYETRSAQKITRVVITGGSASFDDMQTYVSYMLDKKVEQANPFTKIAYPAFMEDALKEIAPTFAVALGAAMRPFEITQ